MTLRAFLVDDEAPARERLRHLLRSMDHVEVIGEADNADSALATLRELAPDLVFLDVQMPGRSGIELAAALTAPRPAIVFCTAFDEYAIRAFEVHALDYLLKPVTRSRLAQTIDRVRHVFVDGRMRTRDLERAADVQARMLPPSGPSIATLEIAGASRSAREIGGDYYDFVMAGPGQLGIAVGDVSGKGAAAALLMASLQGRLQTLAPRYGADVTALVTELNRDIWRTTEASRFVTLFYGVYDSATRQLSYVNAGHNPPRVLSPSHGRDPQLLTPTGPIVGAFEHATFTQTDLALLPGDCFVAFTDGISEAREAGDAEFGEAQVASVAASHATEHAAEICDHILAAIDRFTAGAPLHDDRTVVVAKIT